MKIGNTTKENIREMMLELWEAGKDDLEKIGISPVEHMESLARAIKTYVDETVEEVTKAYQPPK